MIFDDKTLDKIVCHHLSETEKKSRVKARQQTERGREISRAASARWKAKQRLEEYNL